MVVEYDRKREKGLVFMELSIVCAVFESKVSEGLYPTRRRIVALCMMHNLSWVGGWISKHIFKVQEHIF